MQRLGWPSSLPNELEYPDSPSLPHGAGSTTDSSAGFCCKGFDARVHAGYQLFKAQQGNEMEVLLSGDRWLSSVQEMNVCLSTAQPSACACLSYLDSAKNHLLKSVMRYFPQ